MDELQKRLAAARSRAEAASSRSSPLAPAPAASGAGPHSSQADSDDASKAQQPRASWQKELDARRQRKSANSVQQIARATEDASAEVCAAPTSGHHAALATPCTNGAQDERAESRVPVSPPSVELGTPGAPSASPPPRSLHPPSAAERAHDANAAAAAAVVTLAEAHGGGGREPSPTTAAPPEGGGQKNYTLWNELVAVRGENDTLGQELSTARAANERLSLILSGMSERLRAQLEALLRRGLHTEERIQMFGELKELLSFEEQFEQVQAIAPSPRSARNAAVDEAGGRSGAVMGADRPCACASSTAGAAGNSASTAELYRNPLAPAFVQKGSSASTAELVAAGEAALVAWKPKLAASPPPTLPPPTPSPPTRAPPTTAPTTAAPPTSPPPRAVARGLPPLHAHEEREPSPFAPPPSSFADAEPSLAATALAGLTHGSPVRRVEGDRDLTSRRVEAAVAREAMAAKEAALDLANAALAKASAAEAAEAEATAMAANASAVAKDLANELAISRGSRQDLANELAILRMEASVGAATAARALSEMEQQAALAAAQAAQALEEARAEASSARLRSDSTVFAANRRCEAEIAEVRMRARAAVYATEEQAEAAVREAQTIAKAAAASAAIAEEELRRERARGQVERATHSSEAERWRAALEEARAEAERCRRNSVVLGADAERYRRSSLDEAHARQSAPLHPRQSAPLHARQSAPSPPLAATLSASAQAERARAQHKRPPPPLASQHTPTSVPKRPVEIRRDSSEAEVDMPSSAGGDDAALMDALMDRIVLTRHWEYIMQGAGSPGDATPGRHAAAAAALALR